MTPRPIIYCALFLACTAMSQPIARFLWTPVVRPFDWRPAYGTNAYNPQNNGSRDTTGLQANNLDDNKTVKWNSLTSLIEFNATETLVVGSHSNERKTRWNSNSTLNATNPNLRLITPTTDPNRTGQKIQIYSAPQRRMIDDRNSSESYLIYSANPLISRPYEMDTRATPSRESLSLGLAMLQFTRRAETGHGATTGMNLQ